MADVGVTLNGILPASPIPTDGLRVDYTVTNPSGYYGRVLRRVYLSTDSTIDPATDRLVNERPLGLFGEDNDVSSVRNLLPQGTMPGMYYLGVEIVMADDPDLSNNISAPLEFTVRESREPFDLSVSIQAVTPSRAGVGDPIDIDLTAVAEESFSGTVTRTVYISRDNEITTDDVPISRRRFDVTNGRAEFTTRNNVLSRFFRPGTYFVGVIIEEDGDTNPANNVADALPIVVTEDRNGFDIGVELESVEPMTVRPGDALTVRTNVRNNASSVGRYLHSIYLSRDERISSGDTLVSLRSPILVGRGRMIETEIDELPDDLRPGNYFVGVIMETSHDSNPLDNVSDVMPLRVIPPLAAPLSEGRTPAVESAIEESDGIEYESTGEEAERYQ